MVEDGEDGLEVGWSVSMGCRFWSWEEGFGEEGSRKHRKQRSKSTTKYSYKLPTAKLSRGWAGCRKNSSGRT